MKNEENSELKEYQIRQLFEELDKNNVGFLDASSFASTFPSFVSGNRSHHSNKVVESCDTSSDGKVTFEEFREFVIEKDKQLHRIFKDVSEKGDPIKLEALVQSFKKSGVKQSEEMVRNLTEMIDSDNDGLISFTEWRDFFLFIPLPDLTLTSMVKFYANSLDFNSDAIYGPGNKDNDWFKYLLAGGVAGAISRTTTAPLDRLKVLLQNETRTHRAYSQIVSIRKGILKIYNSGGVMSFFKGNGLNVAKIIPESALKFYTFEAAKDFLAAKLELEKNNLPVVARFAAGGAAGLVSQFAIYPIETIKTRIMSQITTTPTSISDPKLQEIHEKNVLTAARNLYRENGIRSFYRGCVPALVGIVPYAGVDLAVFETLKVTWMKLRPGNTGENIPTPILLTCGMISGACGAILMYPLSLIRTRLQAQGTPSHPTYYSSTFDAINKTYQREGLVGFYRGLAPTMLKVLPAISISYVVYENSKRAMKLN